MSGRTPSTAAGSRCVFPFLLDGELVARVDLKADREAGVLRVPGAFAEPSAELSRVTAEPVAELHVMAGWLGLDGVVVGERGDLAAGLGAAVRQRPAQRPAQRPGQRAGQRAGAAGVSVVSASVGG
jgi:Winged helix DNA-binding domain